MDPSSTRSDLRRFVAYLLKNGLTVETNPIVELEKQNGIEVVKAKSPGENYFNSYEEGVPLLSEYFSALKSRNFTVMLIDGSILQISFTFQDRELLRHRLCYYPAPININTAGISEARDEIEMLGLLVKEQYDLLSSDSELFELLKDSKLSFKPSFRFDFDRTIDGHPSSHLHYSFQECRIPVYGALSLGHFIRFVFRHYQPQIWENHEEIRAWPTSHSENMLNDEEMQRLHINCERTL